MVGNRNTSRGFGVLLMMLPKIPSIKLVAAKNQAESHRDCGNGSVFAHGIGRSLVPGSVGEVCSDAEQLDEAAETDFGIRICRMGNVPVKRGRMNGVQKVNTPEAGIECSWKWEYPQEIIFPASGTAGGALFGEWNNACPVRRP